MTIIIIIIVMMRVIITFINIILMQNNCGFVGTFGGLIGSLYNTKKLATLMDVTK